MAAGNLSLKLIERGEHMADSIAIANNSIDDGDLIVETWDENAEVPFVTTHIPPGEVMDFSVEPTRYYVVRGAD